MKKIYLGFINYASASESALRASAWLDAAETKKLHSMSRESSRKSFLAGRTLVRSALATLNGSEPSTIQLDVQAGGKPVCNSHADYHFSLSHSGGLAAIAVSQMPIGLDLEAFHPTRDMSAIAKTVFGLAEQEALFGSEGRSEQSGPAGTEPQFGAEPDSASHAALGAERHGSTTVAQPLDTARLFHVIWTLKEAWLKLRGLGLNELSLCPDFIPTAPGRVHIRGDHSSPSCQSWTWGLQDSAGKEFVLSVAAESDVTGAAASSTLAGPPIHILPDFTGGVPALVLQFQSDPART